MRRTVAVLGLVLATSPPARALVQTETPRKPVAVVVRVSSGPLFTPDGTTAPDRDARLQSLAAALDALQAADIFPVPFAIAPSPVLCDEAMRLRSSAARHFVRSMRKIATRASVLTGPFANVRLTDVDSGSLGRDLRSGRIALERCTRRPVRSVLYPPALALNAGATAGARGVGIASILSDAVDVPTHAAGVDLLPTRDVPNGEEPGTLLARTPEAALSVVVADPGEVDVASYMRALQREPRIDLRALPTNARGEVGEVGEVDFRATGPTPASYRRALVQADRAFDRFESITLRDNPTTGIYRDLLARARSTADLQSDFAEGRRRAVRLVDLTRQAEHGISVAAGTITFTSRRGSVPVTVSNHNPYPVRVTVAVSSPKLDFPDGSSRVVVIPPSGDTITFVAVARSTGSFPMVATVSSGDGSFELDSAELTVRSTAANLPALALTIGGAILLVFFSVRRKKREASP